MVTLREALFANREILGNQYNHFGKNERTYLSYDKTSGWSVVQFKGILGFVKEILRRLGFYASIQWKTVHSAYLATDKSKLNLPHSFCVKIDRCARHALHKKTPTHRRNCSSLQFFVEQPSGFQMCTQIGSVHISLERGKISCVNGVEAIVATPNAQEEVARAIGKDREAHFREIMATGAVETEQIEVTNAGLLSDHGIRKIMVCGVPPHSAYARLSLRDLYHRLLDKAHENELRSVAFPMSHMGYDVQGVTEIAMGVIDDYAKKHPECFSKVKLIVSENDYIEARNICRTMFRF